MPANPDAANAFHALHKGGELLLLANAWDALSARIAADAGAKAIATSSAAVAWSHGYADGHHLPMDRLLTTVANIARVIAIPLSVDMEGGYADTPEGVAENVRAVIGAGGIGMNIEDGKSAADLLCRKIEAARAAAEKEGVAFFINARTDVYLKQLAPPEAAEAETIRRGNAYRGAGASGFFVPGPTETALFARIAAGVALPVNVMARPGVGTKAELEAAGVKRLSAATAVSHAAYNRAREAAQAFLAEGSADALWRVAGAPGDYNAMFK